MDAPLVIGWKERIDFPEWGGKKVRVKMDTGARTSAIHALVKEVCVQPDETKTLKLELIFSRRRPEKITSIEVPVVGMARVRNSGGVVSVRYVIETTIRLGTITKRVRFTIADRGSMLSVAILGRFALAGDFLVDSSRKYVLTV
ncbi:MAG: RimK/LysX family protein [Planctomycetes bacterium]|nr:RimK/LysX family protein [Planctomycetota bacterium]